MALHRIEEDSFVTDIVLRDYRAAEIFHKYEIGYCCGGKWPLKVACEARGLDPGQVRKELEEATRPGHSSHSLPFEEWPLDFLANYIELVHHAYLKKALPLGLEYLEKFVDGHREKFPYLDELHTAFLRLMKELLPHLQQEEEVIFPYIKQIAHAYYKEEPYATLFVRILRKPVEETMLYEHEVIETILNRFRELTDGYTPPPHACISHRVTFSKLREIDGDLLQHIHLENHILFPRYLAIEKELLAGSEEA